MKKLCLLAFVVTFVIFAPVNNAKSQLSTVSASKEILINYMEHGPANFVNVQGHNVNFEEIGRQDFINSTGRHLKVIYSVTVKNATASIGKYLLTKQLSENNDISSKDVGINNNITVVPLR